MAARSALIVACLAAAACSGDTSAPTAADPLPQASPVEGLANETIPNYWTTRTRMPTARSGAVAAAARGKVYVIGGTGSNGAALTKVDAYNPTTTTLVAWVPRAPLPSPRTLANGAVTMNGKIYVAGGMNAQGEPTRTLYVYDLDGNFWVAKAQMPFASYGGVSGGIDGKLYVVVTSDAEDDFHAGTNHLLRYNPETNSWLELAPAPNHHHRGVARVINGKLYVAGGLTLEFVDFPEARPWGHLDVYNPATNVWVSKGSMPTARWGAAAGVLNGKLYVAGGYGADPSALSKLEFYNPTSSAWGTRVNMPTGRGAAAGAVVNGVLYVLGGGVLDGDPLRTNESYVP
jgi:N-acetylneuraminic acid mutarotase